MPRTLSQWLEHIERQHPASIELGLDRVRAGAQRMGLCRPARKVVSVAGTNGCSPANTASAAHSR